ncbi:AraC family transcriptional regulator [Intrasporangium flavum]|uniref:AraC family transcriptional regulator n=1 Tax=Intrasporangium flavum TaxID=1428657 RepID=UPI00096CE8F6|nr:AraC family transcriptional regulator [Intrasporangium flavum]
MGLAPASEQRPRDRAVAWRPAVPGVAEVFHADWHDHAYPAHTHDTWTLLVVDDGVIGYGLDRHDHTAVRAGVTLLPPHVVHDGHAVTDRGFRKRVVYLEEDVLGAHLVGRAVDRPLVADTALRTAVSRLDRSLVEGEDLEAESRLALVVERLTGHLTTGAPTPDASGPAPRVVARRARELLDADPVGTPGVAALATALGVSTPHLVRSFAAAFGLPPHRYVVGRRLDLARRLLLDGLPAASVAVATGFHDQAHLTRHFRAFLGTTPGRYQRGR